MSIRGILIIGFIASLNFLNISCTTNNTESKNSNPQKNTAIPNNIKFMKDSLIGKWKLSEMQFRRYEENKEIKSIERGLISRSTIRGKDSLMLDLKTNNKFAVNDKEVGEWKLENDLLILNGEGTFGGIPLFLNVSYAITTDKFCWYITTPFFSKDGLHHEVRYTMLRIQ